MIFEEIQSNDIESNQRPRICIVATIPFAFNVFMRSHIDILKESYDVTLIANGSIRELGDLLGNNVSFVSFPIERKISLIKDLVALFKLWKFFRNNNFDAVCSLLPKSGLLAMLAARLAGVPVRLNIFNGEVWAYDRGFMRHLLRFADKVIVACATRLLAVSPSQREFLIKNSIVKPSMIEVVANGSITGVDVNRFKPYSFDRERLRLTEKIPFNAVVFLFLGRLNRDKGLIDLLNAFNHVAQQNSSHHLMIVGPDEEGLDIHVSNLELSFPGRIHRFGFTDKPEIYMRASDVICLPSYREGFGMVLIEAAAIGLPAIASRIYGVTDAVEEGVTGILHTPGNSSEISQAMLLLGADQVMRKNMGMSAQKRVIDKFSQDYVMRSFAKFYREVISSSKRLLIVVNSARSLLSHRLQLALAAQRAGYEVHIASAPGVGVDAILEAGLFHHSVPMSRSGMNLIKELQTILSLIHLFSKLKPDIVHLVTIKPVLYGGIAARLIGVPGVVMAVSGLGFVFINTGLKVLFVRFFVSIIYRIVLAKENLRVIFQNSDDSQTIMSITNLRPAKVAMIRGSGVDLAEFQEKPLPPGVPIVVMVSRLLVDKGVHEFVEAAIMVRNKNLNAYFCLVGDPDFGNPSSISEEYLLHLKNHNIVNYIGHRDNIPEIFSKSHIVVLPSYREGLPKVLLEAAACGRAVITTDVPGCRHAVEPGITAILVPSHNAQSLADAISSLLLDRELCMRMGHAGRQLAEREFSIDKVVASHMKIYDELIKSS